MVCYECRYRLSISGDAHSRCKNIDYGKELKVKALNESIIFCHKNFTIKAEKIGFTNGWFYWPFNFDPSWLIECTGFEKKNKGDDYGG
jgi:hypothetical protein